MPLYIQNLIDCHRHHGGSTPIRFIEHAMSIGACPVMNHQQIIELIVCTKNDNAPNKFNNFLNKFKLLDKIAWNEDLIDTNIKMVCEELRDEQISAALIDFSVSKYRHIGWSLPQAIEFILDRFKQYATIPVIPILSIKYESPTESQFKIAKIIDHSKVGNNICGIDFVGDENHFNPIVVSEICNIWRGRFVRLHVGESGPIENIRQSLKFTGITNIAHGIKIIEDNEVIKEAIDKNLTFDTALSSNYLTGVTKYGTLHPILMMASAGLTLTIGSDDPVQCSTTLKKEIAEILNQGMPFSDIIKIADNGYRTYNRWREFAINRQLYKASTMQYTKDMSEWAHQSISDPIY
jgi:adenosine deaminase